MAEYSKDLILPTKSAEELAGDSKSTSPVKPSSGGATIGNGGAAASGSGGAAAAQSQPVGVRIATENLQLTTEFHCTAEDIYRAFTVKEMVQAFTRSSVIFEPEKGGKFALFNGMVQGVFLELVSVFALTVLLRSK